MTLKYAALVNLLHVYTYKYIATSNKTPTKLRETLENDLHIENLATLFMCFFESKVVAYTHTHIYI